MRLSQRLRRDDGFTLVELLVVMVVLAVVIAPLTAAIIVYLRNTDQTTDRMAESHDAQIAAAWFTRDVQNVGVRNWAGAGFPPMQSIETAAPATGGLYPCGPASTPAALVRFAWNDPAANDHAVLRVSYVVTTVGEERQLRRLACDGNGNVTSEVVLAHFLDPGTDSITCYTAMGGPEVPCTTAPPPHVVQLELGLRAPSSDEPYTVTLTAQRRQA